MLKYEQNIYYSVTNANVHNVINVKVCNVIIVNIYKVINVYVCNVIHANIYNFYLYYFLKFDNIYMICYVYNRSKIIVEI